MLYAIRNKKTGLFLHLHVWTDTYTEFHTGNLETYKKFELRESESQYNTFIFATLDKEFAQELIADGKVESRNITVNADNLADLEVVELLQRKEST